MPVKMVVMAATPSERTPICSISRSQRESSYGRRLSARSPCQASSDRLPAVPAMELRAAGRLIGPASCALCHRCWGHQAAASVMASRVFQAAGQGSGEAAAIAPVASRIAAVVRPQIKAATMTL